MTDGVVTIFGGTGFLGRHIVRGLSARGRAVRVAVRRPQLLEVMKVAEGAVTAVDADIRDDASVAAALAGADAAVNAVGLYVERGLETFDAVHVEGAQRLARLSARAGVQRLIHISGIGAVPDSPSKYVRARAAGESAVRGAFEAATILRPSVLFGPGDAFFTTLAAVLRLAPAFPLIGRGSARLQPVYVDDVAEAVAVTLANPATSGRTYELGGPKAYAYKALVKLLLDRLEKRRLLLPIPVTAWKVLAALASLLPSPPITGDQIVLASRDNVVDPRIPGFADLGIEPTAVEAVLPRYLS